MFVPSATGALAAPATLTFHYSDGTLQATKTFTFDASYVLHAHISVTRNGAPERALLSWPGGFGDQNETLNGRAYTDGSSTATGREATSTSPPRRSPAAPRSTDPSTGPASAIPSSPQSFCPIHPQRRL